VKEFGALHDDALAGLEPRDREHALAVERLDPHRARLELPRGIAMPSFCSPVVAITVTSWPARSPAVSPSMAK
jgi:hypothetical protein